MSLESKWNVILLIVLSWSLTLMISTSIRKVLMVPKSWCVVGWYVVVGFEVVNSIPIQVLDFFNLVCTFFG